MVTPETFLERYPEFECVKEAVLQRYIDTQLCQMNACVWGDKLDLGLELAVAHRATVNSSSRAGGGLVTSNKVGDLSQTYAIGADDADAFWKQTQFGIDYLELRCGLQVTPRVI